MLQSQLEITRKTFCRSCLCDLTPELASPSETAPSVHKSCSSQHSKTCETTAAEQVAKRAHTRGSAQTGAWEGSGLYTTTVLSPLLPKDRTCRLRKNFPRLYVHWNLVLPVPGKSSSADNSPMASDALVGTLNLARSIQGCQWHLPLPYRVCITAASLCSWPCIYTPVFYSHISGISVM